MAVCTVEHVVADAGAFLKNAPLQEFGKTIYTLKEVVNEIRDKETKRRLAVLPYQLHFKEPFPEYIRHVTEFCKKTGDYPSLSATDIKVLALTYQLEAEFVGIGHLKNEPAQNVEVSTTLRHPESMIDVAGFHLPSKHSEQDCPKEDYSLSLGSEEACHPNKTKHSREVHVADASEFSTFHYWRNPLPSIEEDLQDFLKKENGCTLSETSLKQHQEEQYESERFEEKDDDDGWITPNNIQQIRQDMGCSEMMANVKVGCLTTDFAMQNVLIQMGLHVISLKGMLIKQARNYILRCHACFKTTTNMNKTFCPSCGNKTLKKVAVTVNEDGSIHMHFSKNPKVLNARGLRYSLPLPHGGKHGNNPHLTEDQSFPQQRLSKKARQKTNVFDPDYIAGISPFVENDIYSRAANLNIRDNRIGAGRRRMNPNAVTKKFVKKK
ncbi:RNA-binding protein NOB1 isoform X2 [Stegostoma tigrinum]|uniref:RNA-binding protein NOB1 isoform X2 n=1 Tax=Stegostoma tigrinum TaxID=3053191 RepID=UPI002870108C|nr:RNA-binding protein NOB1 isoform X2 [Stegostoma tigrinum]